MRHKKLKIGCLVGALLLITVFPLFFNALSVPVVVGNSSSPKNDEILADDENLETSSVISDLFKDLFRSFFFHVSEFYVNNPDNVILYKDRINFGVRIIHGGGLGLQLVRVRIKLTLNTGEVMYYTKITDTTGWVHFTYLNARSNTQGTYTLKIIESSLSFLLGIFFYDSSENEVPLTQIITL